MRNRIILVFILLMIIPAFLHPIERTNKKTKTGTKEKLEKETEKHFIGFEDKDEDSKNDLFRDKDGDGVNDVTGEEYDCPFIFVDKDKDGKNDLFQDANGDGVNDLDTNFIDVNEDGINDNIIDFDGDGINDISGKPSSNKENMGSLNINV